MTPDFLPYAAAGAGTALVLILLDVLGAELWAWALFLAALCGISGRFVGLW